ncbi:MAG: hypothetical protein PHY92_10370 [Alphaproteobacteria bacterium]|nr:hypothetical protein [Alphaproteobacteria bacterium]
MSSITASFFDDASVNSFSLGGAVLYQRNATNALNATLADAVNIGTLKTDESQLDVLGQISRTNSTNFYKLTLDGNNMKMSLTTSSSLVRAQVLNSSGTVIADNSTSATSDLQTAFANLASSNGLSAEAGDYFVKVTYDATATRSASYTYLLSLYSGTVFSKSFQTTAKSQTSEKQAVTIDNTMVFSTSDALEYSVNNIHLANETATTGLNIGWIYENKAALSVTSQLTETVEDQYYTFSFQKGDNLKLAFNNHTDTATARVQLLDMSGKYVIADSDGTDAQKEAYAALTSSDGMSARVGQYVLKISFAEGESRSKNQIYDFKLYSGTSYTALYETTATTETAATAVFSGHLSPGYSPLSSMAAYLTAEANGEETNIMDTLMETI